MSSSNQQATAGEGATGYAPRQNISLEQQYPPPPMATHQQQIPATAGTIPQQYQQASVGQGGVSSQQAQPYDPQHHQQAPFASDAMPTQQYPPYNPQQQQSGAAAASGAMPQQQQPYFPPPPTYSQEAAPPQPPRPQQQQQQQQPQPYGYNKDDFYPPPQPQLPTQQQQQFGAPPQHTPLSYPDDDLSNPIHYTRDPHRIVGYLVPFPKPNLPGVDPAQIPPRFLIYTPPPPPLQAPAEGEKEERIHKLQRKWQNEVREAKTTDAKLASWKGVKSRATKGISWAMGAIKPADLEFLNRIPAAQSPSSSTTPSSSLNVTKERSPRSSLEDRHANDGKEGSDHRTVGLEALDLIYPPSLAASIPGGDQALRTEFINNMMRTKSRAQRDAVLATGLLPVSFAVDILATVIWPFGGLAEIDGIWAYSSIRGAKTARSVTKRLASSTAQGTLGGAGDEAHESKEQLQLRFVPSTRLEVLRRYLAQRCVERDGKLFAREPEMPPSEATVLAAIGWQSSQAGGETRNWEDEQWETQEVKEDLKMVFTKAAKSWDKWCKAFAKDPEKALKK